MRNLKAQLVPALLRKCILTATSVALVTGVMALATPTPADAQGAKWCSRIKGATSCMYQSKEQCRASISGRGGTCIRRRS